MFGSRSGSVSGHGATASTTGLVVDLLDGTRVNVAHAEAGIDSNTPGGLLSGRAQSARGTGLVETNNIVKKSVPCTGTGGEWRNAAAADTDLLPGVDVGAATVGALGDQLGQRHAVARTRAKVARLALFGDDLVVTAIRSQANVTRQGGDWIRTAQGTSLGEVTVDGVQQPLPAAGESLLIDGVARITPGVVHKSDHAITVVGLQVKLLGGSDAGEVLNISQSNARIAVR